MKRLRLFFQRLRERRPYLNILLAAFALAANQFLVQGFCQPVAWAWVVLILGIGAFLVWPWLVQAPAGMRYGALFLQGLGFTVCGYCAWFMSLQPEVYRIGLFFFWLLVPALVWVPVLFGIQILRRVSRAGLPGRWPVFLLGTFALTPALWWAEQHYRQMEAILASLPLKQRIAVPVLVRVLPRTYMLERVAGKYFRYHTFPEFLFDGWRPPLHDPLLVLCLQMPRNRSLYSAAYPNALATQLGGDTTRDWLTHRVQLYQALFPDRPAKADCVCSHDGDGDSYRGWIPGARQ